MRFHPSALLGSIVLLFAADVGCAQCKVTRKEVEAGMMIVAENHSSCAVTISLNANPDTIMPSRPLPFTTELAAGASMNLCILQLKDPKRDKNWDYGWAWHLGSASSKHDDSVVYALPYPRAKTYAVSQGYGGALSHTDAFAYSIDWDMPVGSEVCAAREGRVVYIKSDSKSGGLDRKYFEDANCVCILHADGTIGSYAHLQREGVKVKLGQTVKVGEVIALSGNTGFSSQPHLHFHVCLPDDQAKMRTIAIKFRTSADNAIELVEGKEYKAP